MRFWCICNLHNSKVTHFTLLQKKDKKCVILPVLEISIDCIFSKHKNDTHGNHLYSCYEHHTFQKVNKEKKNVLIDTDTKKFQVLILNKINTWN